MLLLSGCAQYSALSNGIASVAADASDRQLDAAMFVVCRGITVGAWTRRFGKDEEAARAWKVMCIDRAVTTPGKSQ